MMMGEVRSRSRSWVGEKLLGSSSPGPPAVNRDQGPRSGSPAPASALTLPAGPHGALSAFQLPVEDDIDLSDVELDDLEKDEL